MSTVDAATMTSWRERLGPVGVWLSRLKFLPVAEEVAFARAVEALGYSSLWTGEVLSSRDILVNSAVLLGGTERLIVGSGIANLWARAPRIMQSGSTTLAEAFPGRFILGVGVSHAPLVERSGFAYAKPLALMRTYLDGMDLELEGGPPLAPRLLAALRPKMVALAAERADGVHSYFVPPDHTHDVREVLGSDRLLVPEQAIIVDDDPVSARALARSHMAGYLALANYVNNLRNYGFDDDDFAGGGSDRLVDAIVAWGTVERVSERVREHLEAGADHVVVQPLKESLDMAASDLSDLARHIGAR